jgi:hypothetical protein
MGCEDIWLSAGLPPEPEGTVCLEAECTVSLSMTIKTGDEFPAAVPILLFDSSFWLEDTLTGESLPCGTM